MQPETLLGLWDVFLRTEHQVNRRLGGWDTEYLSRQRSAPVWGMDTTVGEVANHALNGFLCDF